MTVLVEARLAKVSSRLEAWCGRRHVVTLSFVTALVAILKGGLAGFDPPVWSLESWPYPVDLYPYLRYGTRGFGWLVGADSTAQYAWMSIGLIVATIAIVGLVIDKTQDRIDARWIVIVFFSGPIMWIVAGRIVHSDVLLILGGAILGFLGSRYRWAVAGALLAILSNPEQAVALSLCLLILATSAPFRHLLKPAALAVGLSSVAWASLTMWSMSRGAITRSGLLVELLPLSLERFFVQLPLQLYAGFGVALLVIVWAMLSQERRGLVAVTLGALVLPLILTATTLDQSRVLVCASIATTSAILATYGPQVRAALAQRTQFPLATTLILVLTLPAIELTSNIIRIPWAVYYPYLQAYILDQLPIG